MKDFQFLRPDSLYLFIPFLIALYGYLKNRAHSSVWEKICSPDLIPYILKGKTKGQKLKPFLLVTSGSLLLLAMAGPSWETVSHPLIKSQSGLVIALDLSVAMNAEDVKPSRLKRALYKINDLLEARKEGQTALIVFSKEPFVVTPLTDDHSTIKNLLSALDTSIMPASGHDVYKAIDKSSQLLKQAGVANGSVLLVTAELGKQDLEKSIQVAIKEGISVSILGLGLEEGSPIPSSKGGFLKDEKGAMILTKLAMEALKQLAQATGGGYTSLTVDDQDIGYLSNNFEKPQGTVQEELEMMTEKPHDQGYWLVLLALPFILPFFRRGFWVLLFISPQLLPASSWWETADQEGARLFHEENYKGARESFQDPDWKAAASFRMGEYEEAANLYKTNQTAEGYYNLGTSLAKGGEFEKSLEAYNNALEIEPEHEDALYNKKLIEEHLKKPQKQEKSDKNKQKQDKKKDQNKEDSESEKNESESEEDETASNEDQDSNREDQKDEKPEQENEKDIEKENEPSKELEKEYQDKLEKEVEEGKENSPEKEKEIAKAEEVAEVDPQREIDDKWLERVPDDPGALLRRKFLHQYRQMQK